jgi:UrcA family protein
MNAPNRILDPTVRDSGYGKLALMGLCVVILTFAIAKQLPARAAEQRAPASSAPVSVADLERSTDAGRQAARDRLHEAARQLCRRAADPSAASHQPAYEH